MLTTGFRKHDWYNFEVGKDTLALTSFSIVRSALEFQQDSEVFVRMVDYFVKVGTFPEIACLTNYE